MEKEGRTGRRRTTTTATTLTRRSSVPVHRSGLPSNEWLVLI